MFSEVHRGQGGWSGGRKEEIGSGWGQTGKGDAGWGWSRSDHITWDLAGFCENFGFHSDRNGEQLWVWNRGVMQSHYRVADFHYIFKGSLTAVLQTGCRQIYRIEPDQLRRCSYKGWWLAATAREVRNGQILDVV